MALSIVPRLRGILGQGLLWGIAWSVIAPVIAAAIFPFIGWPYGVLRFLGQAAMLGAIWGSVAGALFASALMLAEQRHTLPELPRWRVALWGAVAGSWPLIMGTIMELAITPRPSLSLFWFGFLTLAGGAGAVSSLVLLRIARRGLSLRSGRCRHRDPSGLPVPATLKVRPIAASRNHDVPRWANSHTRR